MDKFFIHESNLERIEKKLTAIRNKCTKNNLEFSYTQTGECDFREVTLEDGSKYLAKFIEVEVEGSIKHEGWRFVATLDHHEGQNIIRAFDTELTIPDKYFTCGPTCEHCNKIRSRKDTYLIYNDDTQEFKQVGKSCLNDYTNGLSAEEVARFISMFDEMIKGECYSGSGYKSYLEVKPALEYAFECVKHFGYEKSPEYWTPGYRSTRMRVSDYMSADGARGRFGISEAERKQYREEMEAVNFNAQSEYAIESTKAAIEWIDGENVTGNAYLNNLQVICRDEYTDYKNFGILVSLTIAYLRHIEQVAEYEKKEKEVKEEKSTSEYQGAVGDRLTITVFGDVECVSSWDSMYGTTWLYKWSDINGNVYTWFASNPLDLNKSIQTVTGTVKKHEEFRNVKQTILTRCKVIAND